MRIFMTGATGFVGRATVLRLRREGHEVVAWVRTPNKAKSILGSEADLLPVSCGEDTLQDCLSNCDAIINLAGEPVAGKRWTEAYKNRLVSSRGAPNCRTNSAYSIRPSPSLSTSVNTSSICVADRPSSSDRRPSINSCGLITPSPALSKALNASRRSTPCLLSMALTSSLIA